MATACPATLIAVVDGGTTRTRLRLWDGARVVWQASSSVGSRDVAQRGRGILEDALRELLRQARAAHEFDRVAASGMISSDVGLIEIPQLAAPVRYAELARAIAPTQVPSIGMVHFIPGIRTQSRENGLAGIAGHDLMRGEEVEVIGLRDAFNLSGRVDFFHAGSHHKLVRTDDHAIIGSVTTLGGELLQALVQHTILASSALPVSAMMDVDQEYWEAGLRVAQREGFGRAAFCVRIADRVLRATPAQASSFLLGAIACLDLSMLGGDDLLVLYGHRTITGPLSALMRQRREVHLVDPETGEIAATRGAGLLLRQYFGA